MRDTAHRAHACSTYVNNGRQADMIVMDVSKAFDKVAPNKLNIISTRIRLRLHKLEWIRSFLSGRTQPVVVQGVESGIPPVDHSEFLRDQL